MIAVSFTILHSLTLKSPKTIKVFSFLFSLYNIVENLLHLGYPAFTRL